MRDPVLLCAGLLPSRLVDTVLVDAAMDPGARGRRPVSLEIVVAVKERPVRAATRDLLQHRLGIRLLMGTLKGIVPGQLEDRPVLRVLRIRELLPDGPAEVIDPVQL